MINFLSKSFEKACSVLAWLNIVFWLAISAVAGTLFVGSFFVVQSVSGALIILGFCVIGVVISIVANIPIFGFFAQVIEVKKLLEKQSKILLKNPMIASSYDRKKQGFNKC